MNHKELIEKFEKTSRRTSKETALLEAAVKETLDFYAKSEDFSAEDALRHIDTLLATYSKSETELTDKVVSKNTVTKALKVLAETDSNHTHSTGIKNMARMWLVGFQGKVGAKYKYEKPKFASKDSGNKHVAGSAN